MALPFEASEQGRLSDDDALAIVRRESETLSILITTYNFFRDYYDGVQSIKYASEEWDRAFGVQFEDFRSNWMEVVVDAMEERIGVDRIIFRDEEGEEDEAASQEIWDTLHLNEFEELENKLYNSALVEGTAYVIVWPDDELGARVDANKAQNVWVRYDSDNPRRISHAIKRWVTESDEMRLTLYTPEFLYKFKVESSKSSLDGTVDDTRRPTPDLRVLEEENRQQWERREPEETGDPEWPLTNPFGEVPIVEFPGRRGYSELKNLTPLQDLLNKTMADMAIVGEYGAFRQKFVVTSNDEPDGGWKSVPGYVWHLVPEVDVEGKPLPTQVGTLEESDPGNYIKMAETLLQHITHISKTPAHYFLQTSQGGQRGDAPSGESLRVTETGLIKKVDKVEERWTRSHLRVGRLVFMALNDFEDIALRGDVSWEHAQSHFMVTLLAEAQVMIENLGLPPEFAWRHIGMTESEIKVALEWREEHLPEGVVVTRINVEAGPGAAGPGTTAAQAQQADKPRTQE